MHNSHPQKKTQKKGQSQPSFVIGEDCIWGVNPVLEYLKNKPDQITLLAVLKSKDNPRIQEIIDLARHHNIKIQFTAAFKTIDRQNKISHQGVVARISSAHTIDLERLFELLQKSNKPPFLVALDSIQDPHNLGAIIRSACAAGAHGIILPKDRSAPLSGIAAKTAAGALTHMNICMVTNLVNTIKKMKEHGIWIFGSDSHSEKPIFQEDLKGPLCLVIGSEGKGLRPLVKEQCDYLLTIPMSGVMESLNASTAAAVLFFEVVRQRNFPAE